MRARCTALTLPKRLEHLTPRRAAGKWSWPISLGAEYLVLSLTQTNVGLWYVTIEHKDQEIPVSAPLALFEVIEPNVSAFWNVRMRGDEIALQPIEFDEQLFCDDVQERRGDALERYRAMKARLAKE